MTGKTSVVIEPDLLKQAKRKAMDRGIKVESKERVIRRACFCAPSKGDVDDVSRWAGVNRAEFLREVGRTGSALLGDGDQALMLEPGILRHQIRLSNGEDCWIYREALEP